MNPTQFADKWGPVELGERAASQEHFLDLCRMVGVETPVEADPKGDFSNSRRVSTKIRAALASRTYGEKITSPGSTKASTQTWTRPTNSFSGTEKPVGILRCS